MDPTKKVNMPHGYPPYEFLLAQSQKLEGMPYMTPFDYIVKFNLSRRSKTYKPSLECRGSKDSRASKRCMAYMDFPTFIK